MSDDVTPVPMTATEAVKWVHLLMDPGADRDGVRRARFPHPVEYSPFMQATTHRGRVDCPVCLEATQ